MAITTVPFTTIALVGHSSGGAIVHAAGGYVANTLIPASIIQAVNTASVILGQHAAAAGAFATNPLTVGVAVVAVAAAGGYCYFYGIPSPLEALLAKAGLATSAKGGIAVTTANAATALVVLGAAGLLTINVYKRIEQARRAKLHVVCGEDAKALSEAAFGQEFWRLYGQPAWLGAADTADQVAGWARSAVRAAGNLLERPVAVADVLGAGATIAAGAGGAAVGSAYAVVTVTVLGSSALGGAALSLGVVSAPVWPAVVGAVGAAGLGYAGWKLVRASLKRSK